MEASRRHNPNWPLYAWPSAKLWIELITLLAFVLAIVLAAAPLRADDEQDCFQGKGPELRIKGCSEMIQRAPNDATAIHNRAVAHGLAGDLDSAIADYTRVIDMAASNASAYDNRARAYASKGDYTHAVEDATRAHALMAKATAQPVAQKARKLAKASKTTNPLPKTNAASKANGNIANKASQSSWWSVLNPWSNSAKQARGKTAKP